MRRLGWVIACLAVVCSTFYAFPATPKKSATPSAAVAAASGVQEALKITQGPCLQAPSETGMTIVWATNKNCLPKVEYGTSSSAMQIAFSARHGLLDANTTLHRIRLSGLKPGAKYYYRPVSTEIVNFQAYKVDFGETIRSAHFIYMDEHVAEIEDDRVNAAHSLPNTFSAAALASAIVRPTATKPWLRMMTTALALSTSRISSANAGVP